MLRKTRERAANSAMATASAARLSRAIDEKKLKADALAGATDAGGTLRLTEGYKYPARPAILYKGDRL